MERNKSVRIIAWRGRRPFRFFNDQFDCFQPLPRNGIIPKANAKKDITVLFRQTFCSPLSRFENQPCFHSTLRSPNVPACRYLDMHNNISSFIILCNMELSTILHAVSEVSG